MPYTRFTRWYKRQLLRLFKGDTLPYLCPEHGDTRTNDSHGGVMCSECHRELALTKEDTE